MWFRHKKKYNEQSDTELITTYKQSGDTFVVGILYERYSHLVYSICYKYLHDDDACKDAVLNIFEKLFSDLKKYEIANFSSWLHSVARNYCFAQQHHEKHKVYIESSHADISEQADEEHELYELLPHLQEAMYTINEPQRICIQHFYLEKKSYQEISTITGFDTNQVKSHIQNGKRNMKNYLLSKRK